MKNVRLSTHSRISTYYEEIKINKLFGVERRRNLYLRQNYTGGNVIVLGE